MYIGFVVFFSSLGLARYRVLMAERRVLAAAVRLLRQIKLAGLLRGEGVGSGVIFGEDAVRCFCLLCLGSGCCVVSGGRGGSFVPLSCEGVRFYCAIDGGSKGFRSSVVVVGINRRLLLGSTVGSCWDRPLARSPVTESTIKRTNTRDVGVRRSSAGDEHLREDHEAMELESWFAL
jgi:hypothetical protein